MQLHRDIMAGNQPSERCAACQTLRPANVVEQVSSLSARLKETAVREDLDNKDKIWSNTILSDLLLNVMNTDGLRRTQAIGLKIFLEGVGGFGWTGAGECIAIHSSPSNRTLQIPGKIQGFRTV
eukprot:gene20692-biopygen6886